MRCPYCDGNGELTGDKVHIGTMILAARQAAGLTQAQLAERVGRSRPQIANIEIGRSDMPVSMLFKFAQALQVQPKDLIP